MSSLSNGTVKFTIPSRPLPSFHFVSEAIGFFIALGVLSPVALPLPATKRHSWASPRLRLQIQSHTLGRMRVQVFAASEV